MAEFETTTEHRVGRRGNGHVRTYERQQLGSLLSRLIEESRTMLLLEVKLAKKELSEKISDVQQGVTSIAVGGLVLYAGLLGLMFSGIAALAQVMDWWLSALIVGGTIAIIGGIMLFVGRNKFQKQNLKLRHTTETLQEGKQWAKSQVP